MEIHQLRKKLSGAVYGLGIVFMTCLSCSIPPHLVIDKTSASSVDLRDLPAGYPSLSPYSHPFSLSPQQLETILQSLSYRERMLLSFVWGPPRPVFSPEESAYLANALSRAFEQALPPEVVAFRVSDSQAPDRTTEGFCFIKDQALHIVIERLKQTEYENNETSPRPNPHQWEFYPRRPQYLFTTRSGEKGPQSHWIVIPLVQSSPTTLS